MNISFNCSDSAEAVLVKVLGKLKAISDNGELRKIRIGGDEFLFVGDQDKVTDVLIDSKSIDALTNQEKKDMDDKRHTIVKNLIPQPATPSILDSNANDGIVIATVSATVAPVPSADPDLDAIVKQAVMDKVNANEMFTAYDITRAVRLAGVKAYHSQIKGITHGMFINGEMTGYSRENIDLPNTSGRPYLYFPPTADPSTYQG